MYEKTNIFKKFINSLYNIHEFPKYIKEGLGRAIVYALLLCILCGLATGLSMSRIINKSITEVIDTLQKDENQFVIEDGILDIENSPLKIQDENTLVYIDDNITLDNKDELNNLTLNSDSYVLMLKDGIYIYSDLFSTMKSTYNEMLMDSKIDSRSIISAVQFTSKFVLLIFIIMNVVQTIISFLMDSLFIALSAMFISRLFLMNFKYSQMYSLTVYAATLPMIMVVILTITEPRVYFNGVGTLGTSLLVFFALRNIRKEIDNYIIRHK